MDTIEAYPKVKDWIRAGTPWKVRNPGMDKKTMISRRGFLKAGAAVSALGMMAAAPAAASAAAPAPAAVEEENGLLDVFKKPKYIFLFIGDGMGTVQIQSARFYKGTVENDGAVTEADLSFTGFPAVGSVTTYDSTSFCPDSASTATSIATGYKTESGVINMCPWTRDVPYETIAEKLHKQKGYKVGVVSTVNIDHATPAAFYAHQASRKNYYDIGVELANSGFEYFAGGEFQKVKGNGNVPDNHAVAAQAGYRVVTSQAEAAALPANAGKTLIIAQNLADGKSMNYAMDAAPGEWQLTDYVKKGIELLDNGKGFFLMTESGKIDWACHANDAAASIHDVLEMSNAVQAAVDFYNRHPNETLILVTADHETGGLAIGYKTTNYDTFLQNLTRQKMSYAKFDAEYVSRYVAEKTPFETAMADVKANFGLTLPNDPDAANAGKLLLTDYEAQQLRDAYQRTLEVGASSQGKMSQLDYELYGTYIPFSMAICHAINHKSGLDHTTYAHTGAPVNLYAMGVGAEQFQGVYDNTEIYHKLAELTKVQ
ncbi:MAG: alkaline phosphatase [Faecalibacterium prausnitzii]|nr:alkaline phosphatase [Faecalibacterium prausnitzii]